MENGLMKPSSLAAAMIASGLLIAAPAFAQSTTSQNATKQPQNGQAQKQPTDGSDPTSQYNFRTTGGQYSNRGATRQQTDGEDVTGNNNFPAASK